MGTADGPAQRWVHETADHPHVRPLGIPVAVDADTPELLEAVVRACRGWEGDAGISERCLHLKLVFRDGPGAGGDPAIQVHGTCIRISGDGMEAWADADSGNAWCALSEEVLRNEQVLQDAMFDPLLLFLLTRSGRVPIHASAFLAGDLAILLLGPSGAGKSCLALAAQQAGYDLLSDDIVYVQSHPDLRIWGIPRAIHVFPEDAPTGCGGPVRIRNGKIKSVVPARAGTGAVTARRAVLCLLTRGTEVALAPIGPEEVMGHHGCLEPGFDLLRDEIEATLELLAGSGAFRLTLSGDPAEAIRLLSSRLVSLSGATSS